MTEFILIKTNLVLMATIHRLLGMTDRGEQMDFQR